MNFSYTSRFEYDSVRTPLGYVSLNSAAPYRLRILGLGNLGTYPISLEQTFSPVCPILLAPSAQIDLPDGQLSFCNFHQNL